jgi:nitrous oxidase accessory protein NosD
VGVIPSTGTTVIKKSTMPTLYDGNTLYVGGSGPNNYTKIQDAIDDASDGDIVYVYSGFYDESLTISATIILQGEAPTTTTINGIAQSVIEVAADNVTIMGFTLESLDVDEWLRGIIFGGNNTEIAYNIFQKLGYGVLRYSAIFGNSQHDFQQFIQR